MQKNKLPYNEWCIELEKNWNLETGEACKEYCLLMYTIDGTESVDFLYKIIDSIRVEFDNGVYESTYNVIWLFPSKTVGKVLAEVLPAFQKRMGKWDQVSRFYNPILDDEEARLAFLEEAKKWDENEKKIVKKALLSWYAEDEQWASTIKDLGYKIPKNTLDPIPEDWPEDWKNRLQEWRDESDINKANAKLFWNRGKDKWIEDLDFMIQALTLSQGNKWREINVWTNPLWFYAKTVAYPTFVEKLKSCPINTQKKVLANIKKVNKSKSDFLAKDLNFANINENSQH